MTAPDPQPRTPDAGAAVRTRHEDGTVSLSWAFGRPRVMSCTPEALEGMVEQHNALTADLAAAGSALEVSESWRDRNAELAETFRDQRDAARSALARVEALCAQADGRRTLPGYVLTVDLRAALAASPAEPGGAT